MAARRASKESARMFSSTDLVPSGFLWPPPTLMTPSMSRPYASTLSEILRLATLSCLKSVMAPSIRPVRRYTSSQTTNSRMASPRNSSLS